MKTKNQFLIGHYTLLHACTEQICRWSCNLINADLPIKCWASGKIQ